MPATAPARFFGPCMPDESSCTTPSALGIPPYPTLLSSGSSSTILTPAMTESSTSAPDVIISNAFCTHVRLPPFLNRFPFAEEMTTGLTSAGIRIVGAANPAVSVMNSRRFTLRMSLLSIRNPDVLHIRRLTQELGVVSRIKPVQRAAVIHPRPLHVPRGCVFDYL